MRPSFAFFFLALCAILLLPAISASALDYTSDFATSPHKGGSTSVGFVEINWGGFSSRLNFQADSDSTTGLMSGFTNSLRRFDTQRLQLDILPFAFAVGGEGLRARIFAGLSYISISEETKSIFHDVAGQVANNAGDWVSFGDEREADIISPRVGITLSIEDKALPLVVALDGFISPVYHLSLEQTRSYDFLTPKGWSNSVSRWSSPYFEYTLRVEALDWLRLFVTHQYQRLDFQTMDWNATGTGLLGYDDVQAMHTFRLGLDVTIPAGKSGLKFVIGLARELVTSDSTRWGSLGDSSSWRLRLGAKL